MAKRAAIVENPLYMETVEFGGMFPFSAVVVYKANTSIDDIIREAAMKDSNLIPLANDGGGESTLSLVCQASGSSIAYMFVDDKISIDTIVHEAVHVTSRLFDLIGSPMTSDTEEFFAYIDTHIFKSVVKIVLGKFGLKPPMFYNDES